MTGTCRKKHLASWPSFITSVCLGIQPVFQSLQSSAVTRQSECSVTSDGVQYQLRGWDRPCAQHSLAMTGDRHKQDTDINVTGWAPLRGRENHSHPLKG